MTQKTAHHTYPPVNRCIYCPSTEDLTDEHIVPFALNGVLILPKSSCKACAKITSGFERACTAMTGGMLYPLRVQLNMKTRRPKDRTKPIVAPVMDKDGNRSNVEYSAATFPGFVWGIRLPRAGLLAGRPPNAVVERDYVWRAPVGQVEALAQNSKDYAMRVGVLHEGAFLRLLAKIAYSFAAAEMGIDHLDRAVADVILGKSENYLDFIGGEPGEDGIASDDNRVELRRLEQNGTIFSFVFVNLFGKWRMPKYHVVVARQSAVESARPG